MKKKRGFLSTIHETIGQLLILFQRLRPKFLDDPGVNPVNTSIGCTPGSHTLKEHVYPIRCNFGHTVIALGLEPVAQASWLGFQNASSPSGENTIVP